MQLEKFQFENWIENERRNKITQVKCIKTFFLNLFSKMAKVEKEILEIKHFLIALSRYDDLVFDAETVSMGRAINVAPRYDIDRYKRRNYSRHNIALRQTAISHFWIALFRTHVTLEEWKNFRNSWNFLDLALAEIFEHTFQRFIIKWDCRSFVFPNYSYKLLINYR